MTTAFLIIDLQQGILSGSASPERQLVLNSTLDAVAAKLGALKRQAEASSIPVILVQHDGQPGHRLHTGSDGWRLREEVAPRWLHDAVLH
jgi:nicotinamidase-related amidase